MNNREDQKCSIEWENTITVNRIWNTNGDQYDDIYSSEKRNSFIHIYTYM